MYKTLPTTEDVEDTMATPLFDTPPFDITSRNSFRNTLEGRLNCLIYTLYLFVTNISTIYNLSKLE